MPNFDTYAFVTRRLKSAGFTRESFDTMVNFILDDVEELFGPRLQHPFGGIYFASSHPRLEWKVERGLQVSKIRLSAGSTKKPDWALLQLTHECVHLLHPSSVRSSVLEEGAASWYQKRWSIKCPELFPEWARLPDRYHAGTWSSYDDAYELVSHLMDQDENSIKRIRLLEPSLSKVTSAMIRKACPAIDKIIADELVKRFRRGRHHKKP